MAEEPIILMVEDNPDDVALVLRAFQEGNISQQVVIVRDGVQALDYIMARGDYADRNTRIAVILLDLKMPKVDGLEVLEQMQSDKYARRIPVVVLTSSKEEQDVISSYDLGVNSYIRKPVDYDEFASVVQQLGIYWSVLNESAPTKGRPR